MARLINAIPRHNCQEEIRRDIGPPNPTEEMGLGSIVECSCCKRFKLSHTQRDGYYWEQMSRVSRER